MIKRTNKGKPFETWVSVQHKKYNLKVIRLRDVPRIEGRPTAKTQNPCDFVTFTKNGTNLIECKACKEARMPISRITQLELLSMFTDVANCYVAIHFYTEKKRVIVKISDILAHDMKSIKHDDDICIDFKEWLDKERLIK